MRRPRLLRSTAFRLALTYLAVFSLSAVILLGTVYGIQRAFVRMQIRETIDAEIVGLAEQYRERGISGLVEVVTERSLRERDRKSLYLLAGPRFEPLAGNLSGWPVAAADDAGWLSFTIEHGDTAHRRESAAVARSFVLQERFHLLVGRSLREAEQFERLVTSAMLWGLVVTILLGGLGGYVVARQMLARVEGINRTIARIMRGDIQQRMAVGGSGDEFDQLAGNLNDMLDEIERLVDGIRAVTDNIAHDLRTPLNRLRSRIEVALLAQADADTLRATLEATLAEAERLLATFNALLTIAAAEARARREGFERLDLTALARDAVELYEPLAEEKGQRMTLVATEGIVVEGDRHLLSQAIANLLDNAVKYAPAGGRIAVTVAAEHGAEVVVADDGPGIPAEAREKVLERFVRLDATRSTPGNGLGLSLVQAVARLHHARLQLEDNDPGLRVRLVFPRAQAVS